MTEEDLLIRLKLIRSGLLLELERIDAAIKELEAAAPSSRSPLSPVPDIEETLPEREEYSNDMSFEHKIRWVLGTLRSANASEITDEIMLLEDRHENRAMLLEIVTHTALKMFSVQKINAIRRSGVIIYSLKH